MTAMAEATRHPGFEILFEDGPCLVVLKPGGLLTQAPPGIDSLERRIKRFLKHRDNRPGKVYLGVPHRLDRPVSGAIVFAKNGRAARRLSDQFQGRLVEKTYWAVVAGVVEPREETWEDYLRKIPDQARAEVVDPNHDEARHAVLHYRMMEQCEAGSLLEIELETGRNHQIRVQAASRGHPVLGDKQYGSIIPFCGAFDDDRRRRIALHARTLAFEHPKTREKVRVAAPLPDQWKALGLNELRR